MTWYLKYKLQLNINFEIVYNNNWIIVKIKALLSFKKKKKKSFQFVSKEELLFERALFEILSVNFRNHSFRPSLSSHPRHDDHELFRLPANRRAIPRENARESLFTSHHHLGNPLLALREMRCVLHLNAGHLELSGCVPFFLSFFFSNTFHAPGNFAKRGDRSSPGYLVERMECTWGKFRKCGETLFNKRGKMYTMGIFR